MEDPQMRFRASRTFQTEQNLARKPEELPDSGLAPPKRIPPAASSEAEMSNKHLQSQPGDTAPRQPTGRYKPTSFRRKSKSSDTQRKPVVTFRQMWETKQQLVADELQRLTLQAERINRLLAEKAKKQTQDEKTAGQSLSAKQTGQTFRQRVKPESLLNPNQAVTRQIVLPEDDMEGLQAQAHRINQLLAELQTALSEGSAIAQREGVDEQSSPDLDGAAGKNQPSTSVSAVSVSAVDLGSELSHPVTHRPTQLSPLQHETQATVSAESNYAQADSQVADPRAAEALRYLANRGRSPDPLPQPVSHRPTQPSPFGMTANRKRRLRWKQLFQLPRKPLDRVGDALLWIVLAVVLRVGLKFLLLAFPVLSPLVICLMLAPAGLAVYLTLCVPNAGLLSVYRPFLVMLGVLLGGKL